MSAAWPMHGPCRGLEKVVWRTNIRIGFIHIEPMFVDMITVHVVKMTTVQVVDVVSMPKGRMPAVRPWTCVWFGCF